MDPLKKKSILKHGGDIVAVVFSTPVGLTRATIIPGSHEKDTCLRTGPYNRLLTNHIQYV